MATRRGRLLQQQWLGLQALRLPFRGVGAAPGSDRFRRGPGARATAFRAPGKQHALGEGPSARPCLHCPAWLDSLPAEIVLKILSYLDAATLLCVGCVNRRFCLLANDKYNWRADSVERTAGSVSLLSVEDREAGYWKREYVMKQMASLKAALAQVFKPVNLYTGLPERTKEALRRSIIGWVIILRESSGREHVLEQVGLSINDSSVTVAWYGKAWPCLATLSTLDLCGVMPVFTGWPKTPVKNGGRRPRWCSLVAQYSLSDMTDSAEVGCDRSVRLFRLDPGLLVGLWKREEELAFVMANLHVSYLVERSTLGSATVPYEPPPQGAPPDDSPERGLRGYQLHVDLHSGGAFCLCGTFGSLPADTGCIEDGYVTLVVIHSQNSVEHLPLIGDVSLCWRTEVIDGCVKERKSEDGHQNCETCFKKPVSRSETGDYSSPVCMRASPSPRDGPRFPGRTSCIDYEDAVGAVHLELVRIEETGEYFIVSLVLRLSLARINHWFGTHY